MRDRLFISYRRADAAQAAGRIRDSLNELFPKSVFVDVEDIEVGEDFVTVIETSLETAAAILVIIGSRWLDGSAKGTKLGDSSDYVTVELQTAIRLGIPLLPILVDGAEMPGQSDIPVSLHSMLRSNALQIRHESFRRDLEPLVAFGYKKLGIVPPTAIEQLMEKLNRRLGWGSRFRYDESMRDWHATGSVIFGVFTLIFSIMYWTLGGRPEFELLLIPASSIYVALIGWNSKAKGRRAKIGLVLTTVGLLLISVRYVLPLSGI